MARHNVSDSDKISRHQVNSCLSQSHAHMMKRIYLQILAIKKNCAWNTVVLTIAVTVIVCEVVVISFYLEKQFCVEVL